MLTLLQNPIIQKALIAGLILAVLFAVLGVYVVLRKMAFWGEGMAHASLAGVALAIVGGFDPLILAIGVAVIFALLVFLLEKKTSLAYDSIIGVIFTAIMALGLVILHIYGGDEEQLEEILFGSLTNVTISDIYIIGLIALVIVAFAFKFNKQLSLLSFDKESAYLSGIKTDAMDLAFYLALAVSVVLGVKIMGILMVSALLIIPSATAKVFSGSFRALKINSIVISVISMLVGLFLSFVFNIPSGPSIVLTATVIFILANVFSRQ